MNPINNTMSGITRKYWIIVGIIVGVGLLARIMLSIHNGPDPIFPDSNNYLNNANYILTGEGKFIFYQSPLYPFFIALIYSIFPKSIISICVAQSFMWVAIVLMYLFMSFKLFNSRRIALFVTIFLSLNPLLIYISSVALSETLFIFFYSLMLLFAMKYLHSGKMMANMLLALFLGLAYLTRNIAFTVLPLMVLWLFIVNKSISSKFKSSIVLIAVFFAVAAPYVYKIHDMFGVWSLHSYGAYNNWRLIVYPLYEGTGRPVIYKLDDMTVVQKAKLEKYTPVIKDDMSRKEKDQLYKASLINYLRENPGEMFGKTISKTMGIFSLSTYTDSGDVVSQSWIKKYTVKFSAAVIYIFFFIGLLCIRGNFRQLFPALSIIFCSFAVFAIYSSRMRYTMSVYPVMIIFAAWGIDWSMSKIPCLRNYK